MNVLFLCTGNSARSILAECYLNHAGQGQYKAFSAGSFPKGEVNPLAIDTLQRHSIATRTLRSKSWDEFAAPGAPKLDLVITVCDNAGGEICPVWPGAPIVAHWSIPDPSDATSFERAFVMIKSAIDRLITQPIDAALAAPSKQPSHLGPT